ncbi:unnamed protein product [Agarophyton chilense]
MINASYPHIEDEATTINVVIQGLCRHPELTKIAKVLTGNPPGSIQSFTNRIRQAILLQENSGQTAFHPPAPTWSAPQRPVRRQYTPSDKKCPKPQGWNNNTELQELSLRLATLEQSFEHPHDPHGEDNAPNDS